MEICSRPYLVRVEECISRSSGFLLGSSIKIGLGMDFQSQCSRGFFGKDSQKHQKKRDCSLDLGPRLFITYPTQGLYNTPNPYKSFLHEGLTGNRKFGISSAFSKPVGLLNALSTVSLHPSPSSWRVKRFCFHTC